MTRLVAACLLMAITFRAVAAQETAVAPPVPLRAQLTDETIQQAVQETLAGEPKSKGGQRDVRVLSSDPYAEFSRQFSEAKVPGCLHPDSLKFQPHEVVVKSRAFGDWVFGVGSIYAAPFWLAAVARGKCKLAPD